jgi:CRISPR-associated protein Cas2
MVVMILETVPRSLRGELSRWLQEIGPGIFVGHVSALVRDLLWEKAVKGRSAGRCYQAYTTNSEQGFELRSFGDVERCVIHYEGLALIAKKNAAWKKWEAKMRAKILGSPQADT